MCVSYWRKPNSKHYHHLLSVIFLSTLVGVEGGAPAAVRNIECCKLGNILARGHLSRSDFWPRADRLRLRGGARDMGADVDDAELQAQLDDERFSYQREAEREMELAEEKAARREREYQEYMEKRRRGEIQVEEEEVKDNLRWPDKETENPTDGALPLGRKARRHKKNRDRVKARPTEEAYEAEKEPEPVVNHEHFQREVQRHEDPEPHAAEPNDPQQLTVTEWLEEIKLGQYADLFMNEGWDTLDAVFTMSQEDLLEIGVKRGHVRRLLLAMGREQDIGSIARDSIARGMSYARGRMEPSLSRQGQARFSPLNIKPWSRDSYEPDYPEPIQDDWDRREAGGRAFRTSVRTRHGPGGKSHINQAGGLGAFLMGGTDEDDYVPSHRRLQQQKEHIAMDLERKRREHAAEQHRYF